MNRRNVSVCFRSAELLLIFADPRNTTHNEHVYAICCRPEVDDDVISGRNVNTINFAINFEDASSSGFRDIPNNHFVTAAEPADADIDDRIKRKRIRVSLRKLSKLGTALRSNTSDLAMYYCSVILLIDQHSIQRVHFIVLHSHSRISS